MNRLDRRIEALERAAGDFDGVPKLRVVVCEIDESLVEAAQRYGLDPDTLRANNERALFVTFVSPDKDKADEQEAIAHRGFDYAQWAGAVHEIPKAA